MKGKFYGIGVGPGDPDLLTLKAVKVLNKADVIICPKGKEEEDSIALDIAKEHIHEKAVIKTLLFPMVHCKETLKKHWQENTSIIEEDLKAEKQVVFLTLGDALLYSTYIYMMESLKQQGYEVETISGITSFSATASTVNLPLAKGKETLTVLPLTKDGESLERLLPAVDNLVILKVSHNPKVLAEKLKQYNVENNFVMISKCGHDDEIITRDIQVLEEGNVPYLSTVIVKKGGF
ncbi:MAG: precorrin-2 C(20)-methyltransferase [Clostridiaceae bacterium]|nr:precorrin-2 C(20)-methyltransferase [Clostridiaceae bacterium]